MFKKVCKVGCTLMVAGMLSLPAWATDYSAMSTEELAALRGTLCNASQEERDAFRQEWQSRLAQMTPEERQQYAGQGMATHHGMGGGSGLTTMIASLPYEELSEVETAGLLYMREEEKLARDVYLTFYEMWGHRVFDNISRSEQKHGDAVKGLLDKYSLEDPMENDTVGMFANADLQALYDSLVAAGTVSQAEAFRAGAAIEDLDISDLKQHLAQTDNADIRTVYQNLMKGSENHLRAFVYQLELLGESYEVQYLSPEEFEEIMTSSATRGMYNQDGNPVVNSFGNGQKGYGNNSGQGKGNGNRSGSCLNAALDETGNSMTLARFVTCNNRMIRKDLDETGNSMTLARGGNGGGGNGGGNGGGHGPGDGTGNGGNGPKDGTGNGKKAGTCINSALDITGTSMMLVRGGRGNGGHGPSDGTGNGGNGPKDGTGNGRKAGTCINSALDMTGTSMMLARGGRGNGGHGPGDGSGNGGNGPKDGTGNGRKAGTCINSALDVTGNSMILARGGHGPGDGTGNGGNGPGDGTGNGSKSGGCTRS